MPASLVSPNVRLPVSGIRGIRLRHWVSRALERLTGPSKRVSVLRYRPGQGCISGPGRHTGHSGHGRIVVLWHGMDTLPRYRGSLNYKVSVCLGPRASGTATSSLRCGRRERTATSSLRCGRRERTATSSLRCGRRERTAYPCRRLADVPNVRFGSSAPPGVGVTVSCPDVGGGDLEFCEGIRCRRELSKRHGQYVRFA
jgi:hypothetical protein